MPSNVKQPSSRKTYMDDNKIDNSDTNNIKMKHCNTKTEIYNRKQNKGVKIGHLNIRSLLKKIDEIKILIHQNSFHILDISETWLSDKIPNELVNIPGFNVYRKDRPSHGWGVLIYIKETWGVLIYIKETLPHTYCPDLTNFNNTEVVWVRIDNKSSPSFYVSCVYNPKVDDENYYQCMLNNFENVLANNKEIVILGDLNINYILDENLCENQAHFIETLLCCKQLKVEPTRVTQSSQSVIDHIHVYTTMPHNHLDHGILKYTLSDHYFIFTTLKFRRQASPPKLINDFIRVLMGIGLFSGVIDAKSTSDAWRDWSNAFNTVVSKHVKIKEIRVKDRSNPWMTNEILAFIYKRDYTHRMAWPH